MSLRLVQMHSMQNGHNGGCFGWREVGSVEDIENGRYGEGAQVDLATEAVKA